MMIFNVILERYALNFFDFSENCFILDLAKVVDLCNSRVVKIVHQECFSPKILKQMKLLKLLIVQNEEIKDKGISSTWQILTLSLSDTYLLRKNRFSFCSNRVI